MLSAKHVTTTHTKINCICVNCVIISRIAKYKRLTVNSKTVMLLATQYTVYETELMSADVKLIIAFTFPFRPTCVKRRLTYSAFA